MSTLITLKLMLALNSKLARVRTRVKDGGTEILIYVDGDEKPIHVETTQHVDFVDVEVSHG